jgi:hypothetical protein
MNGAAVSDTIRHSRRENRSRGATAVVVLATLLALFVRWYFVTHAQVLQPLDRDSSWGDAGQFYRYAWNLVHHGIFSTASPGSAPPLPDSFRDPGYPAFLAIGMAITSSYDHWFTLIILAQVALGGIAVACTTLAIRDAVPTWLLGVAATLMALWPHMVSIPAYVLSENLTAPLCAVTALALREAAVRRSPVWAASGGMALALAALTNAVLAPLAIVLALAFAWKRTMPRRLLLVFVAAAAVPLLAWSIRNAGLSVLLSPSMRAEINLVQGSWPTYHSATQLASVEDPVGVQTVDAINLEIATLHDDRAKGLRLMVERMSHAPGTYIAWYLRKPALLWGWEIGLGSGDIYMYPTRNSPFITNPVMKAVEAVTFIFNGVLAALALAGVIVVARKRTPSAAMITFAVIAAWVTAVYGLLQSDARYSTPFRPAEISLACVAVLAAAAYARGRIGDSKRGPY